MSDSALRAYIREGPMREWTADPKFYALFTESMIRAFEPQKIEHWRYWKRRTLATNAVVVKKESEGYIRFAGVSYAHGPAGRPTYPPCRVPPHGRRGAGTG